MVIEIVFNQMLIMGSLMVVGYLLTKMNLLSERGVSEMSTLLLNVCTPMIMVNAFIMPFSIQIVYEIALTVMLSLSIIAISILIARLCFGKDNHLERFGSLFSNSGFIGIPLVISLVGSEYVFYVSIFIIVITLVLWTYGISLISKSKDTLNLKKVLVGPAFIGLYVGLFLFVTQLNPPAFAKTVLEQLSSLNSILAMIILGHYIAKTPLSNMLNGAAIKTSIVRLLIIPIAVLAFLSILPNSFSGLKQTLLIISSTPLGIIITLFANKYDQNTQKCAGMVSLSTVLSIATIPIILYLSSIIW